MAKSKTPIGKRITEIRTKKHVPLVKLAQEIGITPDVLRAIEIGKKIAGPDILSRICQSLSIHLDELYDGIQTTGQWKCVCGDQTVGIIHFMRNKVNPHERGPGFYLCEWERVGPHDTALAGDQQTRREQERKIAQLDLTDMRVIEAINDTGHEGLKLYRYSGLILHLTRGY